MARSTSYQTIYDGHGVSREALYDVMAAGPLRSAIMDFVKAYGVDGDATKLGFSIRNASKDVGYYRQMSLDLGVESTMSTSTNKAFSTAVEQGMGDNMVSEMVDFFVKDMTK